MYKRNKVNCIKYSFISLLMFICVGCMQLTHQDHKNAPDKTKVEKLSAPKDRFQQLLSANWNVKFEDTATQDWQQNWSLDGKRATVTNSSQGMTFSAGKNRRAMQIMGGGGPKHHLLVM